MQWEKNWHGFVQCEFKNRFFQSRPSAPRPTSFFILNPSGARLPQFASTVAECARQCSDHGPECRAFFWTPQKDHLCYLRRDWLRTKRTYAELDQYAGIRRSWAMPGKSTPDWTPDASFPENIYSKQCKGKHTFVWWDQTGNDAFEFPDGDGQNERVSDAQECAAKCAEYGHQCKSFSVKENEAGDKICVVKGRWARTLRNGLNEFGADFSKQSSGYRCSARTNDSPIDDPSGTDLPINMRYLASLLSNLYETQPTKIILNDIYKCKFFSFLVIYKRLSKFHREIFSGMLTKFYSPPPAVYPDEIDEEEAPVRHPCDEPELCDHKICRRTPYKDQGSKFSDQTQSVFLRKFLKNVERSIIILCYGECKSGSFCFTLVFFY